MSRIPASRKATDSSDQQSSSSQKHSVEHSTIEQNSHSELDEIDNQSGSNKSLTGVEGTNSSSNRNQELTRTNESEDQDITSTTRPSPSIPSLLSDSSVSESKLKGQHFAITESDYQYAQESQSSRVPPTSNVSTQQSSLSSSPRVSQPVTPFSERSNIPLTESTQSFYPSADQFSRAYTESQIAGREGEPLPNETQQATTSQQYTSESYVPQAAYQRRLNQQKSISRPSTSRRHSLSGMSRIRNGRKYRLVVVQHPERARMCGFGDKV